MPGIEVEEPEVVTLKNGMQEVKQLVAVTTMSLRGLMAQKPIVFYELVQLCRNGDHRLFGRSGDDLKALSLVSQHGDQWHVHDSIRNIVLSASEGEGMDLKFVNPLAT